MCNIEFLWKSSASYTFQFVTTIFENTVHLTVFLNHFVKFLGTELIHTLRNFIQSVVVDSQQLLYS